MTSLNSNFHKNGADAERRVQLYPIPHVQHVSAPQPNSLLIHPEMLDQPLVATLPSRHALKSIFEYLDCKELAFAQHVSHDWKRAVESMWRWELSNHTLLF